MTYKEIQGDLFKEGKEKCLAHCISADFGMGKGIVVEFNRIFNMKQLLVSKYHNYLAHWDTNPTGTCIYEEPVFNLITKRNYWNKPTYDTLRASLLAMKQIMINRGIHEVCMPFIGCGLDGLQWDIVKLIIIEVFEDTDFTINVYYL